MKPHHEYGLLVSFLNVSAVRYGMFGQFIYFYLFFASASPLVCSCLFSVLLVCLYLFFLCRPSYSPFFSKKFLSILRNSTLYRKNPNQFVLHLAPKVWKSRKRLRCKKIKTTFLYPEIWSQCSMHRSLCAKV